MTADEVYTAVIREWSRFRPHCLAPSSADLLLFWNHLHCTRPELMGSMPLADELSQISGWITDHCRAARRKR